MIRDWLKAIPHTHRNRWLEPSERHLLERLYYRKTHREAERKIHNA